MYSNLRLGLKYILYYLTASNGKGHGIHSPFVFKLVKEVLNEKCLNVQSATIEAQRKKLLNNRSLIEVLDRGAGSRKTVRTVRQMNDIAKSALKSKKYSSLLFRLVRYFQPEQVIELGTSLGITTAYLAAAIPNGQIVTIEGAPNIANIAKTTFSDLAINNIKLVEGDFDDCLPAYMSSISSVGIAYIDGNHQYHPTLRYFHLLKSKVNEFSILIFDDIHWSREMEAAWNYIQNDESVTLTVDLFFIGLVFFRKAQKEKEHFIIRY